MEAQKDHWCGGLVIGLPSFKGALFQNTPAFEKLHVSDAIKII